MVRLKRSRDDKIRSNEVQNSCNDSAPISQSRSSNTMSESNSTQAASHLESSQNQPHIQETIEVESTDILEIIDTEGRIKRKRGIQHAKDVWNLPMGERIVIKCNRFGQPLKKGGGILSGWLGLVARMGNWCPIGYKRWKIVPSRYKIDVLNLTRSKFVLPNSDIDKWVLKSLSRKWKNFRFELKAKYMLEDLTEQQLASNVPHGIVPHQWVDLVRYWFSEKCQLYSQVGKTSRSLHTTHHTTDSMSFGRKRDEFEIEHGREPSRLEFFIETHKRKDGTLDKPSQTIVDNVGKKIVEKGGTSESSEATSELQDEVYTDILGKDRKLVAFLTLLSVRKLNNIMTLTSVRKFKEFLMLLSVRKLNNIMTLTSIRKLKEFLTLLSVRKLQT
ncbi:uncharacterized protein LOC109712811 [Ananas comosus]|uniref:Uncharacterized protein LOC109712811 n=1 Tax=Ananas comosus TaxID=4615 RepID=A0A6P5F972_ANACO|nr:uncharacterized protein LOC109712811 [Ananas comosus]